MAKTKTVPEVKDEESTIDVFREKVLETLNENGIEVYDSHIGSDMPVMWLDGKEVSRTLYSELFEAIGDRYGNGDGCSTFNLPDLKGDYYIEAVSKKTEEE